MRHMQIGREENNPWNKVYGTDISPDYTLTTTASTQPTFYNIDAHDYESTVKQITEMVESKNGAKFDSIEE